METVVFNDQTVLLWYVDQKGVREVKLHYQLIEQFCHKNHRLTNCNQSEKLNARHVNFNSPISMTEINRSVTRTKKLTLNIPQRTPILVNNQV